MELGGHLFMPESEQELDFVTEIFKWILFAVPYWSLFALFPNILFHKGEYRSAIHWNTQLPQGDRQARYHYCHGPLRAYWVHTFDTWVKGRRGIVTFLAAIKGAAEGASFFVSWCNLLNIMVWETQWKIGVKAISFNQNNVFGAKI